MDKKIEITKIINFFKDYIITIDGKISNMIISNIRDAKNVDEHSLDWINPLKLNKQEIAENTKAKIIICDKDIDYSEKIKVNGKVLIHTENPKLLLAKVAKHFFVNKLSPSVHPSAVIHSKAIIGRDIFIGPNTIIGKCIIGDNCELMGSNYIHDNVKIGKNVVIHAGSIIGTDGLGCEREKDGRLVKFPHFGRVIIEDYVEIGANCQIAKGSLSNTIIGQGSKINVGCFIAHNVVLGHNVWISPKTNIAGSVKVEDNVTIFSGVIIREQKTIGRGSTIGMGSVVTKNIPANETWIGNPAKKMKK